MKRPTDAQLKRFFKVDTLPTEPKDIALFLNKWFLDEHGHNPHSINCGNCFNWAFLFWALNKGKRCSFISDPHHVVTKINGRLYSSEFIAGTVNENPHNFCEKPWHWSVKLMIAFWARRGVHYDYLEKIVKCLTGKTVRANTADVQKNSLVVNALEF